VFESLTPRERQVLRLIVAGRTSRQIAAELGIAFKTAACHRQRLLDKCAAGNTAQLVQRAVGEGWALEPTGAPWTRDQIERLLEETQRCRQLLNDAVARSRILRRECEEARAELRRTQTILRQTCKELAATVRPKPEPYFFSTSTAKA
jgi:DNA-binding CsgD family transcriptional regulator